MKVLVYRYGSICEPYILHSFKEFGFEVIEYDKEVSVKNYDPRVAVKEISDFLQDTPVDFIFSINFFPYVSEVCNIFKLIYLSWIVDSPVLELYSTAIARECNRVFLFDRALFNEISPLNPGRVFHLPLAGSVADKEKLFENTDNETKVKFSHDLAFVGSLYTEKCPYDLVSGLTEKTRGYLEGLMDVQKRIYGYYFIEDLLSDDIINEFKDCLPRFFSLPYGNFLTDKRTMAQFYIGNKISAMERVETFTMLAKHFDTYIYTASDTQNIPHIHNMGTAKTLSEMPIIFNQSRINLNITSKIIRTGLPLRIFDILSSGGFLISNYQEEIPELFEPGEELVVYTDLEELKYLVGYYLDHDRERERIAKQGFIKLRDNYTYEKQMEKMLALAFDL